MKTEVVSQGDRKALVVTVNAAELEKVVDAALSKVVSGGIRIVVVSMENVRSAGTDELGNLISVIRFCQRWRAQLFLMKVAKNVKDSLGAVKLFAVVETIDSHEEAFDKATV